MSRRNPSREPNRRSPLLTLALGAAVVLAIVVVLALRGSQSSGGQATATPAPTQAAAQPQGTPPTDASGTPIVVPSPVIPPPKGCPPNTAAQVNNPARYGFCTPVGWGAYNNNNSLPITLIMKPRPGGPPVLEPTDFDRIQILVALDAPQAQDQPADCKGAPNDSIGGLAAHHCGMDINPDNNPYHASRIEYWNVDLFQDKRFYITALIGGDVTPDDTALMNAVVHAVVPPGEG